MPYRCLADFLDELEQAGELVRVEAAVDANLEAAEITARAARRDGPALLFGDVTGHETPVLTNLFGTVSRICRALGVRSPDEMAQRIALLVNPSEPEGWFERLKTAPHVDTLSKAPPRTVKSGACQQVVRIGSDVDLNALPILRSAPQEPKPTITAATLLGADPDSHAQFAGRWDLTPLDANRLAAGWAGDDEPARLLAEYRGRGEKMPLAAVLGGDPAILLAACAALPPRIDAFALAGLFREKPLDVVACRSVDLTVPADAEIVIEGYVDPAEPPVEAGPICTPLGLYSRPRPMPVMHVLAVTQRARAILPAMVPGTASQEACVMTRTLGRMFLPLLKAAMVELEDFDLPGYGAARHWGVISIEKTYAGNGRRAAHAAWTTPTFRHAKVLVVVDADEDVHDTPAVLAAIAANVRPDRDVFFEQGPADPSDPATPPEALAHKMAIDATAKLPGETSGPWPEAAAMSEQIRQQVDDRWDERIMGSERP